MKKQTLIPVLALLLLTSITACKKSIDAGTAPGPANGNGNNDTTRTITPTDTTSAPVVVAYPAVTVTRCPGAPDYGDTILYIQPTTKDYFVSPINHPDTGTYFAWPEGMIINKNTGVINVTKSEGGLRYKIGYVKKGTTDTCLQTLILAGVSYADSLYILGNNERYAKPYYNADPTLVSICDPGNGSGGNSCEFDINGTAAAKNVIVDHDNGYIDLKTTASRAFGLLPLNGTKVTATIAYQLNDKSNMAPQEITVDFIYYFKKSDVPADLLSLVTDKLTKILSQVLLINLQGASSQQIKGSPRPPIIIVTRFAQ